MKRLLAASLLAVTALGAAPALAGPPIPGGVCEDPIDFVCRLPCDAELDCGLVPPCVVWVQGRCLY